MGSFSLIRLTGQRLNKSGFTLVEVLAATVILSIGLMGVISAIAATRDTQQRTVYMAIARDIAISQMEDYRWTSKWDLWSIPPTRTSTKLPSGNLITCSWSPYPGVFETKMFKCRVTVSWPEAKGNRSISYESLFYKR